MSIIAEPAIRGITVAVGEWYAKTLSICLPRNAPHFAEVVVVTSPDDEHVPDVVASVPNARLFATDGFTRPDARGVRPRLNKGLCIEECFDFMGRHGWLAVVDADILLPPGGIPADRLKPDSIHGARRRILEDPGAWHEGLDWRSLPLHKDGGPVGFLQVAHADAPALRGRRPWYDVTFAHCGGGDAAFLDHFPAGKRAILPMEVLHLGPVDRHWFGTDPESIDMMARFVTENGWRRAAAKFSPEQVARAPEPVERVEVPGYGPSAYELPFVRRSRRDRAHREQQRGRR